MLLLKWNLLFIVLTCLAFTSTVKAAESEQVGVVTLPPVEAPDLVTDNSCKVDENGFLGMDKGIAEVVQFFYQLEVTKDTDRDIVESEIIPALEDAFSNALAPHLITACGAPRPVITGGSPESSIDIDSTNIGSTNIGTHARSVLRTGARSGLHTGATTGPLTLTGATSTSTFADIVGLDNKPLDEINGLNIDGVPNTYRLDATISVYVSIDAINVKRDVRYAMYNQVVFMKTFNTYVHAGIVSVTMDDVYGDPALMEAVALFGALFGGILTGVVAGTIIVSGVFLLIFVCCIGGCIYFCCCRDKGNKKTHDYDDSDSPKKKRNKKRRDDDDDDNDND